MSNSHIVGGGRVRRNTARGGRRRTPTSTVGHWFSNWGVNTGLDLCRNPTRFPYFETGVKMTPCSNLMGAHLSLPQRWQTKGIGNRSKPLCVVTAQRASVRPIDRQSSESAVTALKAFTHVYVFVPLVRVRPSPVQQLFSFFIPPSLSLAPCTHGPTRFPLKKFYVPRVQLLRRVPQRTRGPPSACA